MKLSVHDFTVITLAIQREMPDVEAVEPMYEGEKTFLILKRRGEETATRYLLGHVERDDLGNIIPGTVHLISPSNEDDN